MKQLFSLPFSERTWAEYGLGQGVAACCRQLGCDGIEGVWAGEALPRDLPKSLHVGYHLTFYPDWLDFWRGDRRALTRKFGTEAVWRDFYGGSGPETLLEFYRADLRRALAWGAEYVVFHVSDISIEEGFTYQWLHTNEEVVDGAAEVINLLLGEGEQPFAFLMENQWWPGLTLTRPEITARLLEAVRCPSKGLLLDTGHLMNCNVDLRTERAGIAWIHRMLDAHGPLCSYIKGIHLHQSLSGAFVAANTGWLPSDLPGDYLQRYGAGYAQVLQIDRHQPFTDPAVTTLVERIAPTWLNHELTADSRADRQEKLEQQTRCLCIGQ